MHKIIINLARFRFRTALHLQIVHHNPPTPFPKPAPHEHHEVPLGTTGAPLMAFQVSGTVKGQVNLQESRRRRIPIGEGPHRYIAARRLLPPYPEPASRRCSDGLEQPAQAGGTGHQQPLANLRVQTRVAVALHGFHQVGQFCPQPLAAGPVTSFPKPRSAPHEPPRRRSVSPFLPPAAALRHLRTAPAA